MSLGKTKVWGRLNLPKPESREGQCDPPLKLKQVGYTIA